MSYFTWVPTMHIYDIPDWFFKQCAKGILKINLNMTITDTRTGNIFNSGEKIYEI